MLFAEQSTRHCENGAETATQKTANIQNRRAASGHLAGSRADLALPPSSGVTLSEPRQPPLMQFVCLAHVDVNVSTEPPTQGPDFHRDFKIILQYEHS